MHEYRPDNQTGTGFFCIIVESNLGFTPREGLVTVTAPDGAPTRFFTIRQAARPMLELSSNVGVAPPVEVTGYIDVTSNVEWNVSISPGARSWLFTDLIYPAERNGDGLLQIIVRENQGGERNGTITVFDNDRTIERELRITQQAAGTLSISLHEWKPSALASAVPVLVSSDVGWTVRVDPEASSWLYITDVQQAYLPRQGRFMINVAAKPDPGEREGTVYVTYGNWTLTVSVTQKGEYVRFLDRFKWNEDGDEWFELKLAAVHAGGSSLITTAKAPHAANLNVYGISTSFSTDMDGVEFVPGRGIVVQANKVYPTIVSQAGQMAFLGVHEVEIGFYHSSVIVFAAKDSVILQLHGGHSIEEFQGIKYITIGAGQTWLGDFSSSAETNLMENSQEQHAQHTYRSHSF